jgi:hypothetical protein
MENFEQVVFISYAWGGESEDIVNEIDVSLGKRGIKIIRDKRDLGYKGSIKEFMERIGQGNCVVVVISDKYLRSANCMFELVEIAENRQFHDRIFPIVMADANIYDPIKRLNYVKYWEEKKAELAEAMKSVDPAHLEGIRDDIDTYDRIRDDVSGLISVLKDMNTLTPEMHKGTDFLAICRAIETRMKRYDSRGEGMKKTESPQSNEPVNRASVMFNLSGQTVTNQTNIGGNNIDNRSINAGIYIEGGQNNQAIQGTSAEEIFDGLIELIEKLPSGTDKTIAQSAIHGLKAEADKGEQADEGTVNKMLGFLLDTAPDIWEVAVNSFLNPVAGIATVFQKIAQRAKAEHSKK